MSILRALNSSDARKSLPPRDGSVQFRAVSRRHDFQAARLGHQVLADVQRSELSDARENGVVNIDVRRGTNRTDWHASLEEAFGEVKLADINANYDFVSVRAGIQPFVSDFRGFIFSDNNLGARVFGAFDNNRYQFNGALLLDARERHEQRSESLRHAPSERLHRQHLSGRTSFARATRSREVFITTTIAAALNSIATGFLVRPALIGDVRPHAIKVGYLGFSGDGHLGRLNLSHSYYFAFGHDERNPIAARRVNVRSNMAALRLRSIATICDSRARSSGRRATATRRTIRASGFDAIFDDPNFVGGQFSFWVRNGIRLTQTGVGLVQPNSLLPSLRSSKIQGQANFVNPGSLFTTAVWMSR